MTSQSGNNKQGGSIGNDAPALLTDSEIAVFPAIPQEINAHTN